LKIRKYGISGIFFHQIGVVFFFLFQPFKKKKLVLCFIKKLAEVFMKILANTRHLKTLKTAAGSCFSFCTNWKKYRTFFGIAPNNRAECLKMLNFRTVRVKTEHLETLPQNGPIFGLRNDNYFIK
jgi:hypothetical protein